MMDVLLDLLPVLGPREAWAIGLIVVLVVLRPVGRFGWATAGAIVVAAVATIAWAVAAGPSGPVAAVAWLALGLLLLAAAIARPLRWEPRTGPGAATALLAGALVVHIGAARNADGALGDAAARWASGTLDAAALAATAPSGPLAWPLAWLLGLVPGLGGRGASIVLGLGAAALTVFLAERLGRRWGYLGTARCTAAAVAWAPPLVLAHGRATAALLTTAAIVASWWALLEMWGGRHRSGRLALASGGLFGVAVGVALWPALLAPLFLRRLSPRVLVWFVAGMGAAIGAAALVLLPTAVGIRDLWEVVVLDLAGAGTLPAAFVFAAVAVAFGVVAVPGPLSPTRLSALTATVLLVAAPWWPNRSEVVGPVAAIPFVLLAAVAPDRPDERWPPDSGVPLDAYAVAS